MDIYALCTAIGALMVLVIMVDTIWTTLTTRGSGLLAGSLTTGLAHITRRLFLWSDHRNTLVQTGTLTIVLLVLFWLGGLWIGWTLIFIGLQGSIVNDVGVPAESLMGYVYFVGFTLSTLGIGDLRPVGDIPRLLTSVAAFNGLILITLMITYAIPLIDGVISRRKLAFQLSLLSENILQLILNTSSPESFRQLESTIQSLSGDIIHCAENRLAYPVLDYFHSHEREFSLGLQLAKVDEALNILMFSRATSLQPAECLISNFRQIMALYLTRCHQSLEPIQAPVPPLPSLDRYAHAGVSFNSVTFETSMLQFQQQRKLLHKLVIHEGWQWSDVTTH
jgi:hypothetical protein